MDTAVKGKTASLTFKNDCEPSSHPILLFLLPSSRRSRLAWESKNAPRSRFFVFSSDGGGGGGGGGGKLLNPDPATDGYDVSKCPAIISSERSARR
jgi:hypothetical protein